MTRIIPYIFFTFLFLLPTISHADKIIKRPDSYNYSRGVEAYDGNNYEEAQKYFGLELQNNDKNGYAYMYLSDVLRMQGETGPALTAVNSALKYIPKKDGEFLAVTYRLRGNIKCLLGDSIGALADYDAEVKCNPKDADSYSHRAELLSRMGRYEASLADCKKRMELEPGDANAYLWAGANMKAMGNLDGALEMYTKGIALESGESDGYALRARLYAEKEDWEKATDDVVTALRMDNNNSAYALLLGLKEPALSMMVAKLKIKAAKEPSNNVWPFYTGMAYFSAEQYAKAIPFFEKAQELDSQPFFLAFLSECHGNMGNRVKALGYIDQALAMDSINTSYLKQRADLLYESQRIYEAILDVNDVITLEPDDAVAYHRRAWYKIAMKDYEGAVDDEIMALALAPDEAFYYVTRGNCYTLLNLPELARKDYEKAIALEQKPADYQCVQYAYLGIGDKEKAVAVNDSILKRDDNAGAYYDAACLYARMKDTDKALEYLKTALEKGYLNFGHMAQDYDMDALRDLPEYKQMVGEYEAKLKKKLGLDRPLTIGPLTERQTVTKEVPFTKENGVCNIKCTINGLPLYFVFDTGAATVSLSMVEATFMMKNGYLSKSDVVGSQYFQDANGNVSEGTVVNLRQVDFGGLKLENVRASVVRNQRAPLLLGQSVLGRLGRIEIDNGRNVVVISSK